MSRGEVRVDEHEEYLSVRKDDKTVVTMSINIPDRIFRVCQDDPDDMDDPFATERMNECQIRWNEADQIVEIFTQTYHSSDLHMLQLDYPTFFKEFRTWQEAMIAKHKDPKK